MNDTAKLELSVLAAALTLGLAGDGLLRTFPWGVNFALWGCLVAAAIGFLAKGRRHLFADGGGWLLAPLVFSPLAFLWHASHALKALNLLALVVTLSLAMLRSRSAQLRSCSLFRFGIGSVLTGFNASLGMFPMILGNREWNKNAGWSELRKTVAVLLGLVLAIPPLLVFGGLLMGADAVFHKLVVQTFWAAPIHILVAGFVTYITGGYLRGLLFGKELGLAAQKPVLPFSLGAIEMGVVLGLLDVLFLAFVTIQVKYFFGGSSLVHDVTGLTYSEYARSGFFALLAVVALVLPFLLIIHWFLRPDDKTAQELFNWLAGVQIALLFVVMASAVQRMRLYVAEYGLSEQRLYPLAFMGWLAVVFIWFCMTVMRGHRERFAFGAMVAGFFLVATLHVIDPDALIARTNMARVSQGRTFDAGYAASLSDDAIPILVAGFPGMNRQDRCTVAARMVQRLAEFQKSDWRSWTYSQYQARKTLRQNESAIRAAICCKSK